MSPLKPVQGLPLSCHSSTHQNFHVDFESTHMRAHTQFFLFVFVFESWSTFFKMSTYYILLLRSFVGQNFSILTLDPGACQPSGPVLLL